MTNYQKIAFWSLISAFVLSASYQAYRSGIMEVPAYDAFGPDMITWYLTMAGVSCLLLLRRRWVPWLLLGVCGLLVAVAIFYYYPVIAVTRQNGYIDWAEGVVYVGLIFVAGFCCLMQGLGIGLSPNPVSAEPASTPIIKPAHPTYT
jgi:hypothetical protein